MDGNATRQLLSAFYAQAWEVKVAVSKVEALRKAQLAMLFGKTLDGRPRGVGAKPEQVPLGGRKRERRRPFPSTSVDQTSIRPERASTPGIQEPGPSAGTMTSPVETSRWYVAV